MKKIFTRMIFALLAWIIILTGCSPASDRPPWCRLPWERSPWERPDDGKVRVDATAPGDGAVQIAPSSRELISS